eukprot:150499_1
MSHRSHADQAVPQLSSSNRSPPNHSSSRYGPRPKMRSRVTMKCTYQSAFNDDEEQDKKDIKGEQRQERYIQERRRKLLVVRKFIDVLFTGDNVIKLDDTGINITNHQRSIRLTTQTEPDPLDPDGVVVVDTMIDYQEFGDMLIEFAKDIMNKGLHIGN